MGFGRLPQVAAEMEKLQQQQIQPGKLGRAPESARKGSEEQELTRVSLWTTLVTAWVLDRFSGEQKF